MADVILKNRDGDPVTHTGVHAVKLTTADGGTQIFSEGEAVEGVEITLDLSGGDQAVTAPAGALVKSAVIKKPDTLLPENIAKDVEIAGVVGTHEGGGVSEVLYATGTYTATVTGEMVIEHKLGVIPDIITVHKHGQLPGWYITGVSESLAQKAGMKAQDAILITSSSIATGSSGTGIDKNTTDSMGFITKASPRTFAVGGSWYAHTVGATFYWQAIGGLAEHTDYFYIILALDGNGNLIVRGGVPEIEQLNIYVDGSLAKTVDYVHGDEFTLNVSDVAGGIKIYTISVEAVGATLAELYPKQYYESVTGVVIPIAASGTCGDSLTWTLGNDLVLRVSGEGVMDDFTAASEQPWNAYAGIIGTVVFEEGITHIGSYALRDCTAVTAITIPETVTSIGNNAFRNTSIASLKLPNGLTAVSTSMCYGCASLKAITIPDSVTEINAHAFRDCTALTTVSIGDGVVLIELYAFHTCSALETVSMGDNVETINYRAFQACSSLKSISIPASVTTLGDNVFLSTGLIAAYFRDTATWMVYSSSTSTSGSTLSSTSLSSSTTAATYLKSTYVDRWWRKT